jgi:hypothetical protein
MMLTEADREMVEKHPDMVIHARKLGKILIDAGIIPHHTTRAIIDISVDGPVTLYIEQFGTARLLSIDWVNALKGELVITRFDDEAQHPPTP